MEDNEVVVPAAVEVPAPEPEATAAPEPEVTEAPEQPKTFSQEEVDALIGKRLAREQRKWERERAPAPQIAPSGDAPVPEQFDTLEAYADALATHKAEELLSKREAQKVQSEMLEAFHDREEKARDKYDDFEQVVYNPKLQITEVMAETIRTSDVGPDVAYYLGSNPKEAERISRLSPLLQVKEVAKLEAKLADNPPAKRTSTAPAPITPVTARTTGSPAFDTTDPRSIKSMSTSDWIEAERKRQIKKMQAKLH